MRASCWPPHTRSLARTKPKHSYVIQLRNNSCQEILHRSARSLVALVGRPPAARPLAVAGSVWPALGGLAGSHPHAIARGARARSPTGWPLGRFFVANNNNNGQLSCDSINQASRANSIVRWPAPSARREGIERQIHSFWASSWLAGWLAGWSGHCTG